jgi:hypothetical protein
VQLRPPGQAPSILQGTLGLSNTSKGLTLHKSIFLLQIHHSCPLQKSCNKQKRITSDHSSDSFEIQWQQSTETNEAVHVTSRWLRLQQFSDLSDVVDKQPPCTSLAAEPFSIELEGLSSDIEFSVPGFIRWTSSLV